MTYRQSWMIALMVCLLAGCGLKGDLQRPGGSDETREEQTR